MIRQLVYEQFLNLLSKEEMKVHVEEMSLTEEILCTFNEVQNSE